MKLREYIWYHNTDKFSIVISDKITRYKDEGLYQNFIFIINNKTIIQSEWGLETFIMNLTTNDSNGFQYTNGLISYVTIIDDVGIVKQMSKEKSSEFIKWLYYCNLPLVEQRKLKLKKWNEKQLG